MEGGRLPSELQKAFVAPNFGCLSFRRTFCRYFVFLHPTVLSGLHLNWWRCTWYFFSVVSRRSMPIAALPVRQGVLQQISIKTADIAFQRSAPVVSLARCFPCQYISYSLADMAWSHSKGNKRQCAKTCAEKIVGRQLLWLLDSCDCPSPFSLYRCLFTRPAFGFVGWPVFFGGVFLNHKRCHAVHSSRFFGWVHIYIYIYTHTYTMMDESLRCNGWIPQVWVTPQINQVNSQVAFCRARMIC